MSNSLTPELGFLGVDIGGTKVALRAEAAGRQAYEKTFRWPTSTGPDADLAVLGDQVAALRVEWGPVDAVGVALPATTDAAGTVLTWPSRPSWTSLDFTDVLRRLFPGVRTGFADDGDLAALAEARHLDRDTVVYLGIGTGVGGGLILAGRPVPAHASAEVGHIVIDVSGERCECDRIGCLQSVASGPATLRRAGRLRGREVAFDDLREGLRADRPWAVDAVHTSCVALAAAVVSLGELLACPLAILGGGFATGLPDFVPRVAQLTRSAARAGRPAPAVESAALGGLSSLHGAVHLARDLALRQRAGGPTTVPR